MDSVIKNDADNPCGGVIVSLANGIFAQENINVKPSYMNEATTLYKSEVTKLDFDRKGDEAIAKING